MAQKGATISMILPRCHHPPLIHHGPVSATHLAGLFFAVYNPLPSAGRGSSRSSSRGGEDGSSRRRLERRQVRPDIPAGSMVAFALGGSSGLKRISCLLHL